MVKKVITIEINLNKAEQGWYFVTIYNSNGTLSKTNVRLTKKDFKGILTLYKKNPVIELVVYKTKYLGNYKYERDIITEFNFDEKDNLIYEK